MYSRKKPCCWVEITEQSEIGAEARCHIWAHILAAKFTADRTAPDRCVQGGRNNRHAWYPWEQNENKTRCDLYKVPSEGTRIQQRRVIWLLFSNHRDRRSVILVSLVLNQAMPVEMSLWTPKRKESSEEAVQRQEIVMVSDARWQSNPVFKCMMAHVRTSKGQWGHSSQVNTKISCYVTILPAWT